MIPLYTIVSTILLLLASPVLLLMVAVKKKYRMQTLRRMGLDLDHTLLLSDSSRRQPVIWLHALSVGEVTSALPLVRGLREHLPAATLLFSASTRSGLQVAEDLMTPHVDLVFPGPLDFFFSVRRYIRLLQPSLFILVETDFWPGWLNQLRRNRIPLLLVNGRISEKSFRSYKRFSFFFKPMFRCFNLLSMQTSGDAQNMIRLGIPEQRIMTLGNLKYDNCLPTAGRESTTLSRQQLQLPENGPLWICGSTHRGEEELLFAAYRQLLAKIPDLCLLIAPRDIDRADQLVSLAQHRKLQAGRRSEISSQQQKNPICILDTIGELNLCYPLATIAFVGGSLVELGGHNPIEPAAHGIPVLFGPHMEDFSEIAAQLVESGGARVVASEDELFAVLGQLLTDREKRDDMAQAARRQVQENSGVVRRHLQVIDHLLQQPFY